MPWRKHNPTKGKHGPIYNVARGVNVRQDARGKWTIFYEKGGVRKNKTAGEGREGLVKALKKAEAIAAKLNDKVRKQSTGQRSSKPKKPTLKEYSKKWLEQNANDWSQGTNQRYYDVLRLHIWPHKDFANRRIDGIKRVDMKEILRKLKNQRSIPTAAIAHSILCGIFDEAVEDELIEINPARNLQKRIFKKERDRRIKKAVIFDHADRDLFFGHAKKICPWTEQLVFKVMAFTGMRLGETLAMRLENFDFHRMTYYVCESYKIHRFGAPKTKNSLREVDLPRFLIDEINAYILDLPKRALKAGKGKKVDLLFLDPKENYRWPYSQRRIQGIMKKVCKNAGLRPRKPHDLRHTYATMMLMAQESITYVKEQLGHYSVQMTDEVYNHWISGEGRSNSLENSLIGPVRNPDGNRIFPHMVKNDGL